MKALHSKIEKKDLPLVQWLAEAQDLEADNKEEAIKEYKQIALAYPTNEKAFNRLMILFRQLKRPKDELYWIDKAIANFLKRFGKTTKKRSASVEKLSRSLAHSMGLADKKGNSVYQPAPIERWQKRKVAVQKKLTV